MAKDKDTENIAISPLVVASSLGMVALGGKASTASQVKTVLSADKLKDEHLHSGLSELLSEVTTTIELLDLTCNIRSFYFYSSTTGGSIPKMDLQ